MKARALLVVGMMLAFIACEKEPLATPQIRTDKSPWGIDAFVGSNPSSTLMVFNDGTQDLVISGVSTTSPFRVLDYTQTPITMSTKGFVQVAFQPPSIGTFNANLTINSNAANEPHLVVPLIGNGFDGGA